MWTDVVYDGPLINPSVLGISVLLSVNEGDLDLDIVW
jgi:hypothetical protein